MVLFCPARSVEKIFLSGCVRVSASLVASLWLLPRAPVFIDSSLAVFFPYIASRCFITPVTHKFRSFILLLCISPPYLTVSFWARPPGPLPLPLLPPGIASSAPFPHWIERETFPFKDFSFSIVLKHALKPTLPTDFFLLPYSYSQF